MTQRFRRPSGRPVPSPLLLAAVAAALLLTGALGGRGLGTFVRDGLDRVLPGASTTGPVDARNIRDLDWSRHVQAPNQLPPPAPPKTGTLRSARRLPNGLTRGRPE